jgi:RNA polymerase sigma-70 factor (ECF subfamily)
MAHRLALTAELPRLRAHARRLCKNDSDASDLVQDTVVRALTYEAQFTDGSNLRAWLQQILRSVFITRYRRSCRERRALERLAHDPCAWTQRDAAPTMSCLTANAEGALSGLPEPFRHVVELVDLAGYEYRDAAQALDVPVGTVMSRLHRARRALAQQLTDTPAPQLSSSQRAA